MDAGFVWVVQGSLREVQGEILNTLTYLLIGKPHPLPYLEGLRATNGRAEHALAFEDSRSGIRAAVAAGLATIGLASSGNHAQLVENGAVVAVDDYHDATVAKWLRDRLGL